MIDLCTTELIKNPEPYTPNYAVRKWSDVIILGYFDFVRLWAESAYEHMTVKGHYVPEVTRHGIDGISISWTSEDQRIVTIIIEPGGFSYRWGKCGVSLPTYTNELCKIPHMLDLFARYLDRSIEVTLYENEESDPFSASHGAKRKKAPKIRRREVD